jgi:hypothetical protein
MASSQAVADRERVASDVTGVRLRSESFWPEYRVEMGLHETKETR